MGVSGGGEPQRPYRASSSEDQESSQAWLAAASLPSNQGQSWLLPGAGALGGIPAQKSARAAQQQERSRPKVRGGGWSGKRMPTAL